MTYREHLSQLLKTCVRKSEAYLDAERMNRLQTPELARYREEWERAEQAHTACLEMIRWQIVNLDDPIRSHNRERELQPS